MGGLCVMTLADIECRVRVQGSEGVRVIAMPGPQMRGYEADVIGEGRDGSRRGMGKARTRR